MNKIIRFLKSKNIPYITELNNKILICKIDKYEIEVYKVNNKTFEIKKYVNCVEPCSPVIKGNSDRMISVITRQYNLCNNYYNC